MFFFSNGKEKKDLDVTIPQSPIIFFDDKAYLKLKYYVGATDEEVSGLGFVEQVERGFRVTDIVLFEQRSSSANTD